MQEEVKAAATQPAASQPAASRPAVNAAIERALGPYKVGPSDVLAITFQTPSEAMAFAPIQARVDRNGNLDLALVGEIKVAGLELEDVERTIRNAYVPKFYKDAAVHVDLVSTEPTNVVVTGAVTLPGFVALRRTERDLLHAIVAAGGVSQAASGKVTLKRLRHPEAEATVDLLIPQDLGKALALAPLESGDIVEVQAANPNTVFVLGLVNAPRPQNYPPGTEITVLQALAASGGLRTDITPREATLIRRMEDGNEVHVKLDLDRISTGKDPNIKLAAGDILTVPYTVETRVQDWINRNIFVRGGFNATVSYNVSGIEYMNRAAQQSGGNFNNDLQQQFDPLGFLNRNAALRTIQQQTTPVQ